MCDLGCGVGYLALELNARGYEVAAVERDPRATAVIRSAAEEERRSGLRILEEDWTRLPQCPQWDNVVMINITDPKEWQRGRRLCRKRLIVAARRSQRSHVRAHGAPSAFCGRAYGPQSCERDGLCVSDCVSLEFGQPFSSEEEMRDYLSFFGGGDDVEAMRAQVVATGRARFPLYLPYRKDMNIFVFSACE